MAGIQSTPQSCDSKVTPKSCDSKVTETNYCCALACFKRPLWQVDGRACKRCNAFSFCKCRCISFRNNLPPFPKPQAPSEPVLYCCEKECFRLPSDQVDGMACTVCRSFGWCECECETYKARVKPETPRSPSPFFPQEKTPNTIYCEIVRRDRCDEIREILNSSRNPRQAYNECVQKHLVQPVDLKVRQLANGHWCVDCGDYSSVQPLKRLATDIVLTEYLLCEAFEVGVAQVGESQVCDSEAVTQLKKQLHYQERQLKKQKKYASSLENKRMNQWKKSIAAAKCRRKFERRAQHDEKMGVAEGFFGEISEMPSMVNAALKGLTTASGAMEGLLETLKEALEKIFTPMKDLDITQLMLSLTQLCVGIVDGSKKTIAIQLLCLARLFQLDYSVITKTCTEYYKKLFGDGVAQGEGFECALPAISTFVGFILTGLYGAGFSFKSYAESLSSFGRAALGWKNVMQMIEYCVQWIRRVYAMWSQGKTLAQIELEEQIPGYEELFASTKFLMHEIPLSFLERSTILCRKVLSVCAKWEKVRFDAYRTHHRELVAQAQAMLNSLRKYHETALNSPALCVAVRPKPLAIYLFGKPGVGKTILQSVLDYKLYGDFCADSEGANLADVFFSRKVENDYWDGYRNQPIVHYDDFLQKPDSETKPNEEYMELIRLVNEDVMQLHMAACEDKKSSFFDSQFIIATTNKEIPIPKSLTDPNAFYRRFDFFIEVQVKKEFSDKDGKYDADKVKKERIKQGIESTLTTFQYQFQLYRVTYDKKQSMTEKEIISSWIDFDALYDKIKDRTEYVRTQTDGLRADLLKLAGYTPTKSSRVSDAEKRLSEMELQYAKRLDEDTALETLANESGVIRMSELGTAQMLDSDEECDCFSDPEEEGEGRPALIVTPEEVTVIAEQVSRKAPALVTNHGHDLVEESIDEEHFGFKPLVDTEELPKVDYSKYRVLAKKWTSGFMTYVQTAVKAVTTFAQRAISCIVDFIVSNAGRVFLTVIGSVAAGLGLSLLEKWAVSRFCKKCSLESAGTFIDSVPCGKCAICTLCFKDWHDEWTGDFQYHINALGTIISYCNVADMRTRAVSILQILAVRLREENATLRAESGEIVTRRKSSLTAQSGEIQTKRKGTMTAQSNETRTLRKRQLTAELGMTNVVTTILEDNGVAQVEDRVMNEQHLKISYTNTVRVSYAAGSRGFTMNGCFIRGTILMVPYHFLAFKEKATTGLRVQTVLSNDGECQEVPWNRVRVHRCERIDGVKLDLALLELPRVFAARPDITKHFISAFQTGKIEEGEAVIATYRNYKGSTTLNTFTSRYAYLRPLCKYCVESTGEVYHMTNGLRYDVGTTHGDCGALVYAKNNLIASKVVGVHLAGYQGEGAAQVVTKELLDLNLQKLGAATISLVDGRLPYSAEGLEVIVEPVIPGDSITKLGDCQSLGTVELPHSSGKTQIIPSAIHGMVDAPTMKPAYLRPVKLGDTVVDPMELGLKKVLGTQKVIDPILLDKAANDVKNLFRETMTQDRGVYDYTTAVRGIEGVCCGINRRTSPGYPYSLFNPSSGKHHWFGSGEEYEFSDEIREDVEKIIENAKAGRRSDVLFSATLKDERRPIAKVEAGKTRVFEAAPQHFVIAARQYFLAFSNALSQSRIVNEVAVGTNVYSYDWTKMARELSRFGNAVVAGDFSNFDGSLNQEILWKVCEIINDWYDDGPENRRIREMLFEEMVCANVVVPRGKRGEVIRQTHSQPSGNPLTVVINSIFNQLVMRMSYLMCKRKAGFGGLCDFRDHVAFLTYGDDNLLNIDPEILEWFNQLTMTETLAELGLTYTDEAKTGKLTPYRDLKSVSFLKRGFVEDGFGGYCAPLDLTVVSEMVNWCKGKEIVGSTALNVETSLVELALHGREVYEAQVERLRSACRRAGVRPNFRTYDEMFEMHYESRYGKDLIIPAWVRDS